MLNLASHDQRDPDLSRNHRVLDELLDLVVSTEVSTERAAFTTSSAAAMCATSANQPIGEHTVSNQSDPQIQVSFPDCGTAACIGGWTLLLSGQQAREREMLGNRAARLLNIEPLNSDGDTTASHRLFLVEDWPRKFRTAYTKAARPATRARIAAARIEHFIVTKGAK